MSKRGETVHLGYAVGSGEPVSVPLAHTFVTGQTQLSGKTTTLRAIVSRSGRRALAFVTKRGERFDGRKVRPYLPREGDQPIPWRLVETILASALGQRSMKYERLWIVNAAKGARSLADVRANVARLLGKARGGKSGDMYMLLGEYLDLVLPEMRELRAADTLDLQPGLNVMELGGVGQQLQAMVIRAALERINAHESGVLTVFPEAWEFAPRDRMTPARDAAAAMARKGAAVGNFLLCDSQDIAGVDTVVRQAASVWIVGVQREANELKRTLAVIKSGGTAVPKASEVATLGIGQFFACHGRHAILTYVQPEWMKAERAIAIAMGAAEATPFPPAPVKLMSRAALWNMLDADDARESARPVPEHEPTADVAEPDVEDRRDETPTPEEPMSQEMLEKILHEVKSLKAGATRAGPPADGATSAPLDEDALFERFKARLVREAPALVHLVAQSPELHVTMERPVLKLGGTKLDARIGQLVAEGFFDRPKPNDDIHKELKRRGVAYDNRTFGRCLSDLASAGVLSIEDAGYQKRAGLKIVKE